MKHTTLSLLLIGLCGSALAALEEIAPPGLAQARQQFFAASGGNRDASDGAIEAFHKLGAAQPGHPIFTAYEGAALALKARDAILPWEKMKHAERGADLVDKALSQLTPAHDEALFHGTPESIEVRLVAANTFLSLPDFMNRRAQGKRALETALNSPLLPQASDHTRAALYAAAAKLAGKEQRSKDEAAWLQKIVALPRTAQHERAAARLKELGQ
ncbi:hypothetical protein [Massilia endophytica]|uniref:hypothetical protein n=1 Tax=Massilia endophytica TaxID=2899220 RepID=UPI001E5C7D65|nr:hypothetical protein [Massilia endophytica]UGQ44859.1 hypothetical protein LSQ66_13730 [Massilia endophytica]